MPPLDPTLTNHAVTLLKSGMDEQTVAARLVAQGAPATDARELVASLVVMKRQAEHADRLRAEAAHALERGIAPGDVVQHLVGAGVPHDAAEAEVTRIATALAARPRGVPCDRCRVSMNPRETYFDAQGNQVCKRCHNGDVVMEGEVRKLEALRNEAESRSMMGNMLLGGLTGGLTGVAVMRRPNLPKREWCTKCNAIGVDESSRCLRCGAVVR